MFPSVGNSSQGRLEGREERGGGGEEQKLKSRIVTYDSKMADNINPGAPDCYFYYYSHCSKVSLL